MKDKIGGHDNAKGCSGLSAELTAARALWIPGKLASRSPLRVKHQKGKSTQKTKIEIGSKDGHNSDTPE